MKEADYAYAVARIRANESSLLTTADIEQLISADNYQSALRVLEEKGWINAENHDDINTALKTQMNDTWQLLREISPNISELDFLVVKNDFHNIKAALKEFVSVQTLRSEKNNTDNFVVPSSIDSEQIKNAIFNKKFNELPSFAEVAAEKTYNVLIRSADGQLADIMLDSMALNATIEKADNTKNQFIKETAELICVTANIKIAFRAARAGKDEQFLETALCQTKTLDKASLIDATIRGQEELINYILTTQYFEVADYMKASTTSLEKWCDDILMLHIKNAKYICLGIEPIIAFYIAKDAEIKNVRIILSCKHNNLPSEAIKERMRKLYV
ncbi:MAG: V-type ATPase subunit [Oscillospiraceae bacterium]|nr:V-type ATPase subunit [Oscillospiraceae bacterium]